MLDLLGDTCIFDLGAIPAGYGWVFPKRDHLNIGLYRYSKRPDNLNMRVLLDAFTARYRILRGFERIAVKAFMIPVAPVARRLSSGGVVLVGDAAGVGDPMFGEGIYFAIRSGNLAAGAIASTLAGRGALSSYDGAMRGLRNVKIILVEPYFDLKTPNSVARETGGKVVVMLPSVGGEKEVTDYFKLFDYDIDLLTRAFTSTP